MTQKLYDGDPLFFPVDTSPKALMDMRYPEKIPEQYGYIGWPWEKDFFPAAPDHNFHFTTQVVYWFEYQASASPTLDFTGDDDVWVFINNHLAVDVGGLHPPESKSVTLDASATMLGITKGSVYNLDLFHAERHTPQSTFRVDTNLSFVNCGSLPPDIVK